MDECVRRSGACQCKKWSWPCMDISGGGADVIRVQQLDDSHGRALRRELPRLCRAHRTRAFRAEVGKRIIEIASRVCGQRGLEIGRVPAKERYELVHDRGRLFIEADIGLVRAIRSRRMPPESLEKWPPRFDVLLIADSDHNPLFSYLSRYLDR